MENTVICTFEGGSTYRTTCNTHASHDEIVDMYMGMKIVTKAGNLEEVVEVTVQKVLSEFDTHTAKAHVLHVFRKYWGATKGQVGSFIDRIEGAEGFTTMDWSAGLDEFESDFRAITGNGSKTVKA